MVVELTTKEATCLKYLLQEEVNDIENLLTKVTKPKDVDDLKRSRKILLDILEKL